MSPVSAMNPSSSPGWYCMRWRRVRASPASSSMLPGTRLPRLFFSDSRRVTAPGPGPCLRRPQQPPRLVREAQPRLLVPSLSFRPPRRLLHPCSHRVLVSFGRPAYGDLHGEAHLAQDAPVMRLSARKPSPRTCSTSAYKAAGRGRRPTESSRSRRDANPAYRTGAAGASHPVAGPGHGVVRPRRGDRIVQECGPAWWRCPWRGHLVLRGAAHPAHW
jgi:hypothetical protein